MIKPIVSGLAAGLLLVGCTTVAEKTAHSAHYYPEARSYTVSDDAMGDVNAALQRAQANGKRVLLVLTADGELVNPDTTTTWRDAASRSENAIHEELAMLAKASVPAAP